MSITAVRMIEDSMTKTLCVQSPYNASFTEGARNLGGRWNAEHKQWAFPFNRIDEVRALCRQVYGTCDGKPAMTREQLKARLAQLIDEVVSVQAQLNKLDGTDGEGVE